MTRYPPDHKERTRERLIETAKEEFRRRGFDKASIDTLMNAAGLTRGGFYAHFDSKEALVREVLEMPSGLRRQLAAGPSSAAALVDAFDTYLDSTTRDERTKCPMVAHAMDAKRGGPERAAIYAAQIEALVSRLEEHLADNDDAASEAVVLATLAVGAATLGAAVGDERLATRIERVAAAELRRRLE